MKKDQICDELRYRILSGEYLPGHTIPPERKLCSLFGVSRVTVRAAVKQLCDENVLERCGRNGTVVKSMPRMPQQTNWGKTILYVYFSSIKDLPVEQDSNTGVLFRGIESFANQAGFSLLVQSEENYCRNGIPAFVDGVIMGGRNLLQHLQEVKKNNLPAVALALTPQSDADMVCWDDFGAGQSAALRAANLGHKKILLTALLYACESHLQPSFRRRICGFTDMAQELELDHMLHIIKEHELTDPDALSRKLTDLCRKNNCSLIVDSSGTDPLFFGGIPLISVGALHICDHPQTDFFYCDNRRIGYLAAERLAAIMKNPRCEKLRLLVPIQSKFNLK